jgi:predicted nuclease with TOPRIM domain
MIEIGFNEFADYWFEKWKSLVAENEKLRIHNKNLLDKINEQRGKLTEFEHNFDEVLEKNNQINKENKRLLQVTYDLHDEIDKLKEKQDGNL